ncbi:MAG: hypothetical protein K9L86_02935 [Candidatus Omnitrophica bacterium]|nr:hypothetical protein [Candidatus Omnitrophota bacterium]
MLSKKTNSFSSFSNLLHLPSFALIIGYIIYWFEIYFFKKGQGLSSPLATCLLAVLAIYLFFGQRKLFFSAVDWCIKEYKQESKIRKAVILLACCIVFLILLTTFFALLLPPHLAQEFDALNYHLTLPRQHLILGSFSHIHWSAADLFPLPIQFALAPYWLIKEIPSKFIHILFVFGLLAISLNLIRCFSNNNFLSLFIGLMAILGSHNVGIQIPILMLDIVICYLFLASIDSFLEGKIILGSIELSFFIWSKSFVPFQMLAILTIIFLIGLLLKKLGANNRSWVFEKTSYDKLLSRKYLKKSVLYLFLSSMLVGGPFMAKSLLKSGTPLFPFSPGLLKTSSVDQKTPHWRSIVASSERHFSTKDAYGSGRSILEFLRHLWLIAVPEDQTTNRYDYPLGLPYLLFLAPFIYFVFISFKKKQLVLLPLFAVSFWMLWWFGSQQARFLYIPLLIIFISVAAKIKQPRNSFIYALVIALLFNFISIFRAHSGDLFKPSVKVLRTKDKQLIEMNKKYRDRSSLSPVVLDYYDVAYANFPLKIVGKNRFWVLEE